MTDVLLCLIGLVLLVVAADHFVMGAARLARAAHLSPVVIGAVVMGFGTSLPELVVSGIAAGRGELALGVGNIVGSNVANLSLVLGAAAFVAKMSIDRAVLGREAVLSVAATVAFAVVAFDDRVSRLGGIVLAGLLILAIGALIKGGQVAPVDDTDDDDWKAPVEVLRAVLGLVGTLLGAQFLVGGSTAIAERYGLSGGFVGFSLVALGTSLPELATTLACARRAETEMIFGNLLGSNIFNSLAVGGTIGLVGPGVIGDAHITTWGTALMVGIALVAFALPWRGFNLSRVDGAILLTLYVVAMATLGLGGAEDESEDDAIGIVSSVPAAPG